jgi:hypothetical protein
LNSSVYRARVTFVICIPFADCQLRDTFRGGKINVVAFEFAKPTLLRASARTKAPSHLRMSLSEFSNVQSFKFLGNLIPHCSGSNPKSSKPLLLMERMIAFFSLFLRSSRCRSSGTLTKIFGLVFKASSPTTSGVDRVTTIFDIAMQT